MVVSAYQKHGIDRVIILDFDLVRANFLVCTQNYEAHVLFLSSIMAMERKILHGELMPLLIRHLRIYLPRGRDRLRNL